MFKCLHQNLNWMVILILKLTVLGRKKSLRWFKNYQNVRLQSSKQQGRLIPSNTGKWETMYIRFFYLYKHIKTNEITCCFTLLLHFTSTVLSKTEWADTHVLPSVSGTITVCFGVVANWPKRAAVNPSQKGCQQACSTQRYARLFDFLLHPRWIFNRLHATGTFWTQPAPHPPVIPPYLRFYIPIW